MYYRIFNKYLKLYCRLMYYSRTPIVAHFCSNTNESLFNLINSMKKAGAKPRKELLGKKKNRRLEKCVPADVCLQVLGNGTRGAPKCVMLEATSYRYLFNCGEGTQRLCFEHKKELRPIKHIFFTYKNWENIGGVSGLALTIQEFGVPKFVVHGPPGVVQLFKLAGEYCMREDIVREERNFWDSPFCDPTFKVEYVPIFGPKLEKPLDAVFDKALDEQINKENENVSLDTTDTPAVKKSQLETNKENRDIAISFICKIHLKPGELSFEKCLEKGVKEGPHLVKLKNGKDITLKNGQIVRSIDVFSVVQPGMIFIVVECPHEEFLDSLLSRKEFGPYMISQKNVPTVELVLHFTPEKVLQTPRYQEWMARFHKDTSHLIINDRSRGPCSEENYKLQTKLNLVHPKIFPLLPDQKKQPTFNFEEIGCQPRTVYGDSLLKYCFRPQKGYNREDCFQLDNEAVIKKNRLIPGVPKILKDLEYNLSDLDTITEGMEYPEVVFLGTGSSYPTSERNVSGILLHSSPQHSLLLDCGEGTFFQMIRFYGLDKIDEVLRKISCVFISHMHADHHLGLFQILKERRIAFHKVGQDVTPLAIMAPAFMEKWMGIYRKYSSQDVNNVKIHLNFSFFKNNNNLWSTPAHDELCNLFNFQKLIAVPVKHCKHACGIAITHKSGWKIVYSGDTMPSYKLVDVGQNCDLLIHEATMEDDLEFEAGRKAHSTTSQAIDIGRQMNARFILLTHFSQRFAKIPILNDQNKHNVGFAFDNMRVCFSDFKFFPFFIPVLKTIFQVEHERIQEVSQRKILQLKLDFPTENRCQNISTTEAKS